MADRDWTEFCHHCKRPLAIYEEVIDRGQNLNEKTTTVTRGLAKMAKIPAYLMAPRIHRPAEVQKMINQLQVQVRELESQYPIVEFRARRLDIGRTDLKVYTPGEWREQILTIHRNHHFGCPQASRVGEKTVNMERLGIAKEKSGLWVPEDDQGSLFELGLE
jgi:hypothetical protein